jgi:coenzyme F420-dependent glucose-6-phosphate dehydrogenase
MTTIGYALSSEEHRPLALVEHARKAEETGFTLALISDHFHPWIDEQGESPFVWSVIGGIACSTESLTIGTGVTCPIERMHPAIVAQAAATSAAMMPGRFFLGLGSGERLNEHVTGARWPAVGERHARLAEAIEVIRLLWSGELVTHRGDYYVVENARIYTVPDEAPEIAVAASGPAAARLAATHGDALISTAPSAEIVDAYIAAGGDGHRYGQLTVCVDDDEAEALRTARRIWPNAALPGTLSQELALPSDFAAAAELVTEAHVAETVVCSSDPDAHFDAISRYENAGFDHVYVHQIGRQEPFFRLYGESVLPSLATSRRV